MKLAVISHTEHYYNEKRQIVGWGATVNELNHLLEIFDEIYHCAPLHEGNAPKSSLPYSDTERIKFIPLKPYGGKRLIDKFSVLSSAPFNLKKVSEILSKVDVFQFRAPTGMGVYMIPYLKIFAKQKGWFKYAGNWKQESSPLGYQIQKFYLTYFSGNKVTINGTWNDQPQHCISFENPCLNEGNLNQGKKALAQKIFDGKLNFVFVGRLEDAKGVRRIIDSLTKINHSRIGVIHLIGDGPQKEGYQKISSNLHHSIQFHGFLPRNKIFELLSESHVFLLPSDSEGFPKVLAEASNFGCIPVVSDISCLSDYVKSDESGFLIDINADDHLTHILTYLLDKNGDELKQLATNAQVNSHLFTYDYYNSRIYNEIVGEQNI